jgi:hypothetical protein
MKSNTLFRVAGLSLALGGMLGPFGHLVLHPPSHALEYQGTSQWVVAHAVLTLSWILILFGLFGLYGHLHQRMGLIGLLGFALVSVLCLYEAATYAFDAFTLPAIKTTFPGEVATAPNGSFQQFPNEPFLGFSEPIGLLLFGIAIFRSRFAQRWSGIALAASVLLILVGISLGHSPLHLERAIPIVFSINSLVFAWIGFGLLQATLKRPQPAASVQAFVPGAAPSAR